MKKQSNWLEKLVETYKVPVTKEKRILTDKQLEILKKRNN